MGKYDKYEVWLDDVEMVITGVFTIIGACVAKVLLFIPRLVKRDGSRSTHG